MPFGAKYTASLAGAANKTKNFLGKAYQKAKSVFGQVDQSFQHGKRIYSALSPVIRDLAGEKYSSMLDKPAMKAIGKYEDVRNQVMEGHDQARHQVGQVVGKLHKAKVNIGL